MKSHLSFFFCLSLTLVGLVGCSTLLWEPVDEDSDLPLLPTHPIDSGLLTSLEELPADELFDALGDEFDVPSDLLKALAWVETSFASPHLGGQRIGWLGLTQDRLVAASQVTSLSVDQLLSGRAGTLLAGTALLDALRKQQASSANSHEADASWDPVLRAWSGRTADWLNQAFVDEVYMSLQTGLVSTTEDSPVWNEPDVVVIVPRVVAGLENVDAVAWPLGAGSPNYPGALRLPAPEVLLAGDIPRQSVRLQFTERSWPESASLVLDEDPLELAHYLVRRSDGLVGQFVEERTPLPSTPAGSIVISIAGSKGSASSLTPQVLEATARLAAYLAWEHDIEIDEAGMEGELGEFFPWQGWLDAVACFAEGGGAACSVPTPLAPEVPSPAGDGARSTGAGPFAVPYFYQYSNLISAGASCQNTSVAMVLKWAGWSGKPDDITARFGKDLAQSPSGLVQVFNTLASEAGLSARISANTSGSISGLKALLDAGKPVIVHGWFTSQGHVVVTTGYDGSSYYVNDPAGQWSQTWKGGYPYGWSASVGKNIRYSAGPYEQAISTSNGSTFDPLWYYDITGVDSSPTPVDPPTEEPGSGPVGPEEDDEESANPWATIEILSPVDGDTVAPSFVATASRTSGKEIEFWSGSYKLADSIYSNPGSGSVTFTTMGSREVVARNLSQWGTVLSTDRVVLQVDEDTASLEVHPTALGESTFHFTASSSLDEVAYVEYFGDEYLLTDDNSGESRTTDEDFGLTYTFQQTGMRLITAHGYSAGGQLLAQGSTYVLVDGSAEVASCSIGGSISCGGSFVGDTSSSMATDLINGYPDIVGNYSGPEIGVVWPGGVTGEVEVRLVNPNPWSHDLDIMILDQSSGECVPHDVVGRAFTSLKFEAGGGSYTFLVDGFDGDAGGFELELDCNP